MSDYSYSCAFISQGYNHLFWLKYATIFFKSRCKLESNSEVARQVSVVTPRSAISAAVCRFNATKVLTAEVRASEQKSSRVRSLEPARDIHEEKQFYRLAIKDFIEVLKEWFT